MAEKSVKVSIDGVETVSRAAKSAEGAVDGLTSKIPAWGKAIAAITIAYEVVSKAIQAVGQFVGESIEAYDRFSASNTKMAAQSKLTGVSLADLKETAQKARDEFGLSAIVANDAATTVAKYASRAGDAALKNQLLSAALDLGAASGLTAAESMDALEQGLRGQDEGFDKLLGKNPSSLWKEYADANGLAVGKMTDTQKRMAELTAVVAAGNIVQGSFNERMQSGAGETDKMNAKLEMAKVAFGAALQPIRILTVQGLTGLIQILTPLMVGLGRLTNFVGEIVVGAFQLFRSSVGSVIEVVGKLTGNDALEAWGKKQSQAFPEFIDQLKKMEAKLNDSGTAATRAGKAHELAGMVITASAKTNADETEQSVSRMDRIINQKLGPPLATLVGMTETAIRSLADAANDQLPPEAAQKFADHMESIAENSGLVEARLTAVKPATEMSADAAQRMAGGVETVARGALDAMEAFGVIDDKAKSTLTSAINIASSIGQIASGNVFAGVSGLLGGVASIVSTMMSGDVARKRLLEANNTQLARLTHEVGNLRLNVTGSQLSGVKDALGSVIGNITNFNPAAMGSTVFNALQQAGLSMSDLDAVAKELGISIRTSGGALDKDGLKQLLTALGLVEPAQFGTDFTSQLDSTKTGFGVFGTGTAGQATQLGSLFGRTSSAFKDVFDINDLAGSKTRLQSLFTRMQNGGISAAEMGGMTGTQFLDAITTMLGLITDLQAAPTGTGTGTGTSTGTGSSGESPPLGTGTSDGAPAGPTPKTLDDVVAGIIAQTDQFTVYHASSLGFQERTANATESTAANTFAALKYLSRIAYGASASNDDMGRMVAVERRLTGDPSL